MSTIKELVSNQDWTAASTALASAVNDCEFPNGAADAIYEAFTAVPKDNAGSEGFVREAVKMLCDKQRSYGPTMAENWKDNYFTIFEPLENAQPYSVIPFFAMLTEELLVTGTTDEEWEQASILEAVKGRLGDDHALISKVEEWTGE